MSKQKERFYEPEILKKVQQHELAILKDFIKVCEENNLSYFGFCGTGIGALRHGGFIPWDDDIDVALLREDYEKLLQIFKRDYSDKYIIVNAEEFSGYPLMTTRITLKDSLFVEHALKKIKCPLGIFLDVYAFDNAPVDEKAFKKQGKIAWLLSKLLILKHVPFPVLPIRGIKAKLAHCVTAMVWFFLNLFCIPHKWLYKLCEKASCKYNGEDTGFYAYFSSSTICKNYFTRNELFPLRKEKFEDIEINFPNNIEVSLSRLYGNFMELPPEEKRINHFPYKLKFPNEYETV